MQSQTDQKINCGVSNPNVAIARIEISKPSCSIKKGREWNYVEGLVRAVLC